MCGAHKKSSHVRTATKTLVTSPLSFLLSPCCKLFFSQDEGVAKKKKAEKSAPPRDSKTCALPSCLQMMSVRSFPKCKAQRCPHVCSGERVFVPSWARSTSRGIGHTDFFVLYGKLSARCMCLNKKLNCFSRAKEITPVSFFSF